MIAGLVKETEFEPKPVFLTIPVLLFACCVSSAALKLTVGFSTGVKGWIGNLPANFNSLIWVSLYNHHKEKWYMIDLVIRFLLHIDMDLWGAYTFYLNMHWFIWPHISPVWLVWLHGVITIQMVKMKTWFNLVNNAEIWCQHWSWNQLLGSGPVLFIGSYNRHHFYKLLCFIKLFTLICKAFFKVLEKCA